jgi:hypothetical protein
MSELHLQINASALHVLDLDNDQLLTLLVKHTCKTSSVCQNYNRLALTPGFIGLPHARSVHCMVMQLQS